MTNHSASEYRWTVSDFRVGRILDRTISIYTHNFLQFSLVTLVAAAVPLVLMEYVSSSSRFSAVAMSTKDVLLTTVTTVVFALLSQSILVYSAFQVLRGRPVSLLESAKIGLRRFVPILSLTVFIVVAIFLFITGISLLVAFASSSLGRSSALYSFTPMIILIAGTLSIIIVCLLLIARWFVVIPVCMVERLGPWRSLTRSAGLTKGHRWRVIGLLLLIFVPVLIVDTVISVTMSALVGKAVQLVASVVWYAIWSAIFGIMVVVTYYELRSNKDGADIEQIASVFD